MNDLLQKMSDSIDDVLENYNRFYDTQEMLILFNKKMEIESLKNSNASLKDVMAIEENLKGYFYRIWTYELSEGKKLITWVNNDKYPEKEIVSCNLVDDSKPLQSYNSKLGIDYDLKNYKAIIGIKNNIKIDDEEKEACACDDVKYNGAVTPSIVLNSNDEILLDSKYIKPKNIIYIANEQESKTLTKKANFGLNK